MNTDVDLSWPEVTADELRAVLGTFDYRRDGWSNAILYLEKHTNRRIAFETNDGKHYLHPVLKG